MILSNLIPEILHNYWAVSHDLNGAVFQLNRSFQRRIIRALNRRRYPDRRGKGARGSHRSWGRGGSPPHEEGDKCRVVANGLTKVLTDCDKLLAREGGLACRHSREGQGRK